MHRIIKALLVPVILTMSILSVNAENKVFELGDNYYRNNITKRFFFLVEDLSIIETKANFKEFGEKPVFVLWGRGDISIFSWGEVAWGEFYNRKRIRRQNKYGTFVSQNGINKWVGFDDIDYILNERKVKLKDGKIFPLSNITHFNPKFGGMKIIAFSLDAFKQAYKETVSNEILPNIRISTNSSLESYLENYISIHSGWPKEISGTSNASPVLADLDGDGSRDLITVVETAGSQSVFAWREDGALLDGWPVDTGYTVRGLSSGDIDGDGMIEIIASCEDTKMYVWKHDGTAADGWPVDTTGAFSSPPSLGDLDGDGDLEIVVKNLDGYVYAWHHDGTAVDGWPINMGHVWSDSTPGLVDIDGDGYLEIFVIGGYYNIYAWHHDGTPVEGWPVETDDSAEDGLAIGDIDKDGEYEIVATEGGYNNSKVHVWKTDGTEMYGWPVTLNDTIQTSPSLGDLDGDGDLEILQSSRDDKLLYAWHHDGSLVNGWPVIIDAQQFINSPSIGDIDGDGITEVLTGYGWYSTWSGEIIALHPDGTIVDGWPISTTGTIYGTVSIGDIDLDGQTEIAVGTAGTEGSPKVYLWDIEGSFQVNQVQWATFAHDFRRTSVYDNIIYEDSTSGGLIHTVTPPSNTTVDQGGTLGPIDIEHTNNTDSTVEYTVKDYIVLPDGNTKTFPESTAKYLSAGQTKTPQFYLHVPIRAQIGTHTFGIKINYTDSEIMDDDDSFEFTVTSQARHSHDKRIRAMHPKTKHKDRWGLIQTK